MSLSAVLSVWITLGLGLFLFAAEMASYALGYRLGTRHSRDATFQPESVGVVVGGLLGLLAFVLALTLSFANARFEERRTGSLAEANAIGTAWLRAEAMGTPRAMAAAHLLEDYARLRRDFVAAPQNPATISAIDRETSALQTAIWGNVSALVRERSDAVAASFAEAVNEAFDSTTAQRFSYETEIPTPLASLLIGMAIFGTGALGYQLGLRQNRLYMVTILLAATWSIVIVDIFDLAGARIGPLRTSTIAYEWTMQGFRGGVPIPPLPVP